MQVKVCDMPYDFHWITLNYWFAASVFDWHNNHPSSLTCLFHISALEEVNGDKVYILGGLVDESIQKVGVVLLLGTLGGLTLYILMATPIHSYPEGKI